MDAEFKLYTTVSIEYVLPAGYESNTTSSALMDLPRMQRAQNASPLLPDERTATSLPVFHPCLGHALESLGQIELLQVGWDSYGAEPISNTALQTAKTLLSEAQRSLLDKIGDEIAPFIVAPLSDGGIQIEWRGSRGDIEVEISPAGDLGYLLVEGRGAGRQFIEEDEVTVPEVMLVVRRILGA